MRRFQDIDAAAKKAIDAQVEQVLRVLETGCDLHYNEVDWFLYDVDVAARIRALRADLLLLDRYRLAYGELDEEEVAV